MLHEDLRIDLAEAHSIVSNLFALSYTALNIVALQFTRTPIVEDIVRRYEKSDATYRDALLIEDVMRTVRHVWTHLACSKVFSKIFEISKKSDTTLTIRRTVLTEGYNQHSNSDKLRWYVRGLFLSDGYIRYCERIIIFHSSRPEILSVALCLSNKSTAILSMFRKYRFSDTIRPYIEIKIKDNYNVRSWFYENDNIELPENEEQLAALIAGLIDGDGSVDSSCGKVRISIRPDSKNVVSRKKASVIMRILLAFKLVKESSLNTKTLLKYNYITIPISDKDVRRVLRKSLKYSLVQRKREELYKILVKYISDEEQAEIINEITRANNLKVRCRNKRYKDKIYKNPYIRGPKDKIKSISKQLLTHGIKFYGPHTVDEYRSEITLPQRLSKYLCED